MRREDRPPRKSAEPQTTAASRLRATAFRPVWPCAARGASAAARPGSRASPGSGSACRSACRARRWRAARRTAASRRRRRARRRPPARRRATRAAQQPAGISAPHMRGDPLDLRDVRDRHDPGDDRDVDAGVARARDELEVDRVVEEQLRDEELRAGVDLLLEVAQVDLRVGGVDVASRGSTAAPIAKPYSARMSATSSVECSRPPSVCVQRSWPFGRVAAQGEDVLHAGVAHAVERRAQLVDRGVDAREVGHRLEPELAVAARRRCPPCGRGWCRRRRRSPTRSRGRAG